MDAMCRICKANIGSKKSSGQSLGCKASKLISKYNRLCLPLMCTKELRHSPERDTEDNVSIRYNCHLAEVIHSNCQNCTEINKFDGDITSKNSHLFLADDSCTHCASLGLDLTARQGVLFSQDLCNVDGDDIKRPFYAIPGTACEFPFHFRVFIPDPAEISAEGQDTSPINFLLDQPQFPSETRIRLHLNDHLRGEEGVRGWILIIEGKTANAIADAIDTIDLIAPDLDVWNKGAMS